MTRPDAGLLETLEAVIEQRLGEPLRRILAKLEGGGEATGLGPWNYRGHPDQLFGAVSYAQFAEDLILLNLFQRLGVDRPSYLDIGAHHPVHCSNTALFYARGSRGVCVEANPNLIPAFAELRPEDVTVNIGVGPTEGELPFYMIDEWSGRNSFDRAATEAFVTAHPEFSIREVRHIPVITLDQVVARHCGGAWPDLLSIDIEGQDLAALATSGLRRGAGPRIICAEVVSGGDQDAGTDMAALLWERGYAEAFRTVGNSLFMVRE
ncbi:FkbM family methyltransferase [Siccirubricoccus sp. KC 17139]|uniref:FkbM family methyltransferase n=1 Tax=Siccirubricoccus soli TaxID=2899147 RepID=A0ABT1CYA3_9PROT|nr:FkbM family methyltransferase [Siccirubricoccus soli]MCO6414642.1 FkbM family methyltransferase [Siccirubricoccus soli]MCP2680772.1 FkbM family methyltransferase [Siccirubricoccus soli]